MSRVANNVNSHMGRGGWAVWLLGGLVRARGIFGSCDGWTVWLLDGLVRACGIFGDRMVRNGWAIWLMGVCRARDFWWPHGPPY